MVFCPALDFSDGWCCESSTACNLEAGAHICSDQSHLDILQYYTCPINPKCGPQKVVQATDRRKVIYVAPENQLDFKEICSYKIGIDKFSKDDVIVLSDLDVFNFKVTLFSGGYSFATSAK